MIGNLQISELDLNLVMAWVSGDKNSTGNGDTSHRTHWLCIGGRGSKISPRGISHGKTCIYTLFQRFIGFQSPRKGGGDLCCAPQVRHARVGCQWQ